MAGDVEHNPGPQSKEESFLNALKSLPSSYKSGLFTSEVIQEKILYILSPRPSLKKEADKWSRIKSKQNTLFEPINVVIFYISQKLQNIVQNKSFQSRNYLLS